MSTVSSVDLMVLLKSLQEGRTKKECRKTTARLKKKRRKKKKREKKRESPGSA